MVFYAFLEKIVLIFAPGFSQNVHQLQMTSTMLYYTFPYLVCISCVGIMAALINYENKFIVPALMPVVLNICMITAALLAYHYGVLGLAMAVGFSGFLQVIIMWFYLKFHGIHLIPSFSNKFNVKPVFITMSAAIVGVLSTIE